MRILKNNENTIIEDVVDFDLAQTLECGQCFRFYKQREQDYVVVAYKHLLHIKQEGKRLILFNTDIDTTKKLWINYFDLNRDYGTIKKFLLSKDKKLEKAIHEKYGVRILNQQFHEMLISFIISQNKQIPQIKQLVRRISENYGDFLGEINGEKYYSFPDVNILGEISEQSYREMKTGFRAPYLFDAGQKLSLGNITSEMFLNLTEEQAREQLKQVKGVGDKVANCVMLFALGYRNAFPVDVWIKRIMEYIYFDGNDTPKDIISDFAKEQYGEYGGYAQQYLFCYGRDNNIGL